MENRLLKKTIYIFVIFISLLMFSQLKIEWRFNWYNIDDDGAYNEVVALLRSHWVPAGFDFDGLQACIYFTKNHQK